MIDILNVILPMLLCFLVLCFWIVYYNLYTDNIEDLHEQLLDKIDNLRFTKILFLIGTIICVFFMYPFGFILGVGGYIPLNEIVKEYEQYKED